MTSAPIPGRALSVTVDHPLASAGRPYLTLWSIHSANVIDLKLPIVQGLLRVDLSGIGNPPLFVNLLGSTGTTTAAVVMPNIPSLIGSEIDIQALEIKPSPLTFYLSDNDVVATFTAGIGTTLIAQGSVPSAITGDFDLQLAANPSMGAPRSQSLPPGAFQVIRHYGQPGFVEGFPADYSATSGASDISVWRGDRVARHLISAVVQVVRLPNGFDLGILRHRADCRQFSLVSIARATGTAHILTDSTVTDSAVSCPPMARFSMYLPQLAFTNDGSIGIAIIHDSASSHTPNEGPKDRVVLVQTDPSKTWTNGKNVLDVTPPEMHAFYDGTLRVAGERVFVEGADPGGVTGDSVLYSGPIDGSAPLTPVSLPRTGTNQPFHGSYAANRISADGASMCFRIGGGSSASTELDDDVVAITKITKSSMTVQNLTKFAQHTVIAPFGNSTVGPEGLRAALSPDGQLFAFVTGTPFGSSRQSLFVARTDGSQAGALKAVTDGKFDPQVRFLGSVHFVTNDRVLFLAGKERTGCDWYAYDVAAAKLVNVTGTTTGSRVEPFTQGGTTGNIHSRGTFLSRNGTWLYFVRGWGGTEPQVPPLTNNIVAIHTGTLALRDITGNDFGSGGTAPSIYRAPLTAQIGMTAEPMPAVELQVRRAPGSATSAFFVAENAAGATTSVFNDCNLFRFDIESAGIAVQLTRNTGSGTLDGVRLLTQLTVSPNGAHVAFAQRLGSPSASEDVVVIPSAGGSAVQLSSSAADQTVTDGSIVFTGSPVDGVAWSVGTGSSSVPFENTVAQWSRILGQRSPLLLSAPPAAAPQKVVVVLGANPTNQ